jgi:hypothetical protein
MRFLHWNQKRLGTGFLSAVFLGALLATSLMVAQDAPREEGKPQEEPKKQDEAKPRPQEENKNAQPSRPQEAPRAQETPRPEEGKPAHNDKQEQKNGEMRTNQEQQRGEQGNAHTMQNHGDEHAMENRGNGHEARGQRIPDDRFRTNFGREHTFRVHTQVVEGQPRFQYGGYWFALANPWPADWTYDDDCYVDYIDGEYVLIDLRHPGIRLALLVVE